MITIIVVAVVVVIAVLLLSVLTINKGYSYEHAIDRVEDSPYQEKEQLKD